MANDTHDDAAEPYAAHPVDPPNTIGGVIRQLGPGLIVTASIVGSGELIVTTKLGADVGFVLLWFIIFGCIIKVFLQIELGRHAISHGRTTLQALDTVPGPRLLVGWLVWAWLLMYVATFFQLAGIVGTISGVFRLGGSNLSDGVWAAIITLSCAVFLGVGRYRLIEQVSTTMVAIFTVFTVFAVGALYWTPYAINWSDIATGMAFRVPDDFTVAFAAFGIIGVGASELIYYPYWCLEKGYAKAVGPNDGTPEWGARARGWMRVLYADAWVSMVVYTGATLAFYALGAAVLHDRRVEVTNDNLVASLSEMYSASFGVPGLWAFLIGAFIVLYSTVFIATASNGRLLADGLSLFRIVRPKNQRQHDLLIRGSCVALPLLYLTLFFFLREPLTLVLIGGLAQATMLPLLCIAGLYFHHNRVDKQLRSGHVWTTLLWIASLLMISAGTYELSNRIGKAWGEPPADAADADAAAPAGASPADAGESGDAKYPRTSATPR